MVTGPGNRAPVMRGWGGIRSSGLNYVSWCAMATAKRAPSPAPTVFVLFGATGDLAHRMVLPAFYRLALDGLLPGVAAGRERPR